MKQFLFLLIFLVSVVACKDKKPSLSGESPVDAEDFVNAFPLLTLPFTVTDTNIKKVADTTHISRAVFTQFIPDTVFSITFKDDKKLTIHPVGKIEPNKKETYLIASVSNKKTTGIYLLAFSKKKFSAGMPLLVSNNDEFMNTATIDRRASVAINKEWVKNDIRFYNRSIYSFDTSSGFSLVLTETNEPVIASSGITNPLDTLPRKNKYSADYTQGKSNFLSLRDGEKPGEYKFYVYFQNEGSDACKGELRGRIKMTSDKAGIYSESGDPCVIDFSFSGTEVKVKEKGTCGNYRGIKCFFNQTYLRKKVAKSKS